MVGAFGIIVGLYLVLWGKAKDMEELKEDQMIKKMISQNDHINIVQVLVDESNLAKPLLR